MNKILHLNFFDFAISHLDFFDFWFFKFRFPFPYSMIIQYYWWIIQCNECTSTQVGAWVLGCEQCFALKFLEFDFRIWIRSPSSLSTICNEGAVVAHGDVCAHVSLRASLSLRSCLPKRGVKAWSRWERTPWQQRIQQLD